MIRGYLFLYMFLVLFLGVASLIHGALFTYPVVWVFNSGDYQVGVSVAGGIAPIITCFVLSIVLLVHEGRVYPRVFGGLLPVFVVYMIIGITLPMLTPEASILILDKNTGLLLSIPIFITAVMSVATEVRANHYIHAARAFVTIFTALFMTDVTTAIMGYISTCWLHLYTEATLIIGGFGVVDGLVVIPIESAIAVLVATARKRKYDSSASLEIERLPPKLRSIMDASIRAKHRRT
jgi:hypothetical protein